MPVLIDKWGACIRKAMMSLNSQLLTEMNVYRKYELVDFDGNHCYLRRLMRMLNYRHMISQSLMMMTLVHVDILK